MKRSDTDGPIEQEYDRRWRLLSAKERFARGLTLIRTSHKMLLAGLAAQHPNCSPRQLKQKLRRVLYNL